MTTPSWSSHWADLPDPRDERAPHGGRCTVALFEAVCRHIVEKHVAAPKEPWEELLPKEALPPLRRCWQGDNADERSAALQRFSQALGGAARECLEHPLVLLCEMPKGNNDRPRCHTWKLVLRCGALMVIASNPRSSIVKTCYFPSQVCRVPKGSQRWLKLLRTLLCRHGHLTQRGIVPQAPACQAEPQPGKPRQRVRFVTLETWGFRTDMEGTPWRGRPTAWPAENDVRAPAPRRLLQRRLVEDELYEPS
jgi:hypothetical protein